MDEDQRKHLEFVQAVISRQAGNSFLVKGWGTTVAAAFFGVSVDKGSWQVAAIGVLAVVAFWYLDAFYLRQERLYRCLYASAAGLGGVEVPVFSMDTSPFAGTSRTGWGDVLLARPVAVLFGSLLLAGFVAGAVAATADQESADRSVPASSSSLSAGKC